MSRKFFVAGLILCAVWMFGCSDDSNSGDECKTGNCGGNVNPGGNGNGNGNENGNGNGNNNNNNGSVEDQCPNDPNKIEPGACGCGVPDSAVNCFDPNKDYCPGDPDKVLPGLCGCGVPDKDLDGDTIIDCKNNAVDYCPDDPDKRLPGICGCGIPDTKDPYVGYLCLQDGFSLCPGDATKVLPGICGCGVSDKFTENTELPECLNKGADLCPDDPNKTVPGVCGCGIADTLDADTGLPECLSDPNKDLCPDDAAKTKPGICGCGVEDSGNNLLDDDGDGVVNCLDQCPDAPYKSVNDECTCTEMMVRLDGKSMCAKVISTASEFMAIREETANNTQAETYFLAENINLGEELESTVTENWQGMDLRSNLISNGKTISYTGQGNQRGRFECSSNYCGLFKTVSGRIQNIKLDLDVKSSANHVGILAGTLSGNGIYKNIQIKGDVEGWFNVGGLAGSIDSSSGQSIAIGGIKYQGNVIGDNNVGGVLGDASGAGDVLMIDGVSIEGKIEGKNNIGGVIGIVGGETNESMIRINHAAQKALLEGDYDLGGIIGNVQGVSNTIYTTVEILNSSNSGDLSVARNVVLEMNGINFGGIIGGIINKSNVFIVNCYNIGDILTVKNKCGGFIGENGADDKLRLINGYMTGTVPSQCNAIIGNGGINDSSLIYYWSRIPSTPVTHTRNCIPFDYQEGWAMISEDESLVDRLNDNIVHPVSSYLSEETSSKWTEIPFTLSGGLNVRIPVFE